MHASIQSVPIIYLYIRIWQRTSDGPASLSVAKGNGEKVEEKKSKIIDEIIATETTYVQDLTEVIDVSDII